jgi:hypothetical protein
VALVPPRPDDPEAIAEIFTRIFIEGIRAESPDGSPVGTVAHWGATAHVRNWTLLTRNISDLARAGVRLLNPFDSPAP